MSPDTFALMATGTPAATSNPDHKSEQEKKRRAQQNLKFTELQKLVSTEEKMSQDEILKVAHKKVMKIKKQMERDPFTQGIYAAIDKTEQLTIRHIKSLKLSNDIQNTKVEALKELFCKIYDNSTAAPVTPSAPTTSASTVEDSGKLLKKNREQGRRDRHKDGYGNLKQFLIDSNYLQIGTKIEKIDILEATIRYITNVTNTIPINSVEFGQGAELGKYLGSTLAAGFYTYDDLLPAKNVDLQKLIVSHLRPILLPPPSFFSAVLGTALLTPPASTSPPGLSNSSDRNINQAPVPAVTPGSDQTPVQATVPTPLPAPKFFRPWEKPL